MSLPSLSLRLAPSVLLLATPALSQGSSARLGAGTGEEARRETAPFRVLDNIEGAHVDLLFAPVRPLVLDEAASRLYALNTHDSRLLELDAATGDLLASAPLPWGPVSLAAWSASAELPPSLLVACRGNHVLARLDRATLALRALIPLPTEPADLLVHPTSGHAFVACAGVDRVVEVDVVEGRIVREYAIPSKEPTFLALDGERVLVAPRSSGNNSLSDTGLNLLDQGPGRVLDLEDPNVATQALPDEDLFAIVPGQEAVALLTDMGAVLFAHGKNPANGLYWQLGTEANNKDPLRMGEPAVRGDIVVNQLALAALPVQGGPIARPLRVIDLDDADRNTVGVQIDPARTVGQPYALAFDSAGNGYLTGMLTNNVTQLSPLGGFVREWDVGSIPRGLVVDAAGTRAFVQCWGSNTLELWDLTQTVPVLVRAIDLGYDPTPPFLARGRELFYDSSHSASNNASCNSCHIDGSSDMLVWDLSGLPFDDKGPLLTQTLVGIADTLPYHWRGERTDLVEFNPAFDGLLGGTTLDTSPGGDFEAFQAFLFSLEQPANPNADPRRRVSSSIPYRTPDGTWTLGDAVVGQDVYFDTISEGINSCNGCHTLPTGTNNDVVLDDPFFTNARRNHKVVAGFNGIWRKESPTLETVVFADGTSEPRPTVGSAISSAGLKDSLKEFVDLTVFNMTAQERVDVTAFLNQVDSGLAPAVHRAWHLDQELTARIYAELRGYLMRQAAERSVDVAVFGEIDEGSGQRPSRWFFDRASADFRSEDSTLPPRTLEDFAVDAAFGRGSFTFLGLPVGMAERFAVDYDEDGLYNADELALGTDPYLADSDGDGDPDGHELAHGGDPSDPNVQGQDGTPPVISNLRVVYVTTRVAKLLFDTDEPTRFDVSWSNGTLSGSTSSARYERNHTVLLRELVPNRSWTVSLDAIDLSGNLTNAPVPGVQTLPVIIPLDTTLEDTSVTVLDNSNGDLRFRVQGRAQRKGGGNGFGMQLRVEVFVNGIKTQNQVIGSTSGSSGITTVEVSEHNLQPGDVVVANIITLFNSQGGGPFLWSMPDTLPANRGFPVTYTGVGP